MTTAWWLSFLWLIPIYLKIFNYKKIDHLKLRDQTAKPFLNGFLWGFWFYFLHSFTFFILLLREGHGQERVFFILTPFIFIGYAALYSGAWFYLLHKASFFKQEFLRIVSIIIITLLYFWSIDTFLLCPFGAMEGYPIVFPLVACAQLPKLLYLLPIVGKWFLMICMINIQLLSAYFLSIIFLSQSTFKKKLFLLVLLLSSLFPFFIGFALPDFTSKQEASTFEFLEKIVVVVPSDNKDLSPYQRAQDLCQKMEQAQQDFPKVEIFFAPESAFPFCLNEYSTFVSLWTQNVLHKEKYFFCGTHLKKGKNVYNNVVLIHKCRIIQTYVKKHLIPFFERIVALPATIKYLNDLFLKNKKEFSQDQTIFNKRGSLHSLPLLNEYSLNPYSVLICSELLFFNNQAYEKMNLRITFMKLNRFNNTSWHILIKNSIQFKLIFDNKPTLIISDNPYFYKDLTFIKINKK